MLRLRRLEAPKGPGTATNHARKCAKIVAPELRARTPSYGCEMGRKPRFAAAGFHHVNGRGNNGRAIFLDDLDRQRFLSKVAAVIDRQLWKCHSFCLMTNHYHLLIETPDDSLPNGMHRLNLGYAQSFNRRYRSTGHVFEAPYHSVPVTRDGHALMAIRYIARNPVEAGLCRSPEEWPWSSYGAVLGLRRAPSFLTSGWVLGLLSEEMRTARRRLRSFVSVGPGPGEGR